MSKIQKTGRDILGRVARHVEAPENGPAPQEDALEQPPQNDVFPLMANLLDDVLRLVLLFFDTHKLMEYRLTSSTYQNVIESIFRAKHSMILLPDFESLQNFYTSVAKVYNIEADKYYHFDQPDSHEMIGRILEEGSQAKNPDHLPRIFPVLNKLIVYCRDSTPERPSSIPNLAELLNSETWKISLQSLTVFNLPINCLDPLVAMSNLTQLELFEPDPDVSLEPLVPMMKNLKSLSLGKCHHPSAVNLLHALNGSKLRQLSLNRINLTENELAEVFRTNSELASNLTHLTLSIGMVAVTERRCDHARTELYGITANQLQLISDHCPQLKFLQFIFSRQVISFIVY